MAEINIRKGMPSVQLDKAEFKKRFLTQFYDPAFQPLQRTRHRSPRRHGTRYDNYRKAPRTVKADQGFTDPDYDLSVSGWRSARRSRPRSDGRKRRPHHRAFLIVNGSTRSDHTCPGEMSQDISHGEHRARRRSRRLHDFEVEVLDLSRLASEYGRTIYPVQGVRFNGRTTLPLAVFLLSQSRDRTDRRLDE